LIPNPIRKVLSTMAAHRVHALLMGGQACVFYGAAEFSRDTDLAVLAEPENLERLQNALDELQAERIAVPPFAAEYLHRGHAVHFRCRHPESVGMRVDVMSKMRGVAPFPELWERRTSLADAEGVIYELLSLPDLVQAKKTQRDKDWPMIRRLLEADYLAGREAVNPRRAEFWLRELRTAPLLTELCAAEPALAGQLVTARPVLHAAQNADQAAMEAGFMEEERLERELDRAYWLPLKTELEKLRHARG
jgi:hypothetical protein